MQDFFEKSFYFFLSFRCRLARFSHLLESSALRKKTPEYHFGSPVFWLFKAFLTFIVVDFPKPLSKLACRDLSGKPCD